MSKIVKIPLNLIISVLILMYLVMRTYGIAGYLPSLWSLPLLMIFVFSVAILLKLQKFILFQLVKESRWIILSLFVLMIYMFLENGNFKLYTTFNYLNFSVPFYIIGYYWGILRRDKYFKISVIGYFIFVSFFLFSKLLQIEIFREIGKETLGRLFYNPGGEESYNEMIFLWPYVAFLLIIVMGLVISVNIEPRNKPFVYLLSLICFISILFSGLSAPIVLIVVAIFVYYFNESNLK